MTWRLVNYRAVTGCNWGPCGQWWKRTKILIRKEDLFHVKKTIVLKCYHWVISKFLSSGTVVNHPVELTLFSQGEFWTDIGYFPAEIICGKDDLFQSFFQVASLFFLNGNLQRKILLFTNWFPQLIPASFYSILRSDMHTAQSDSRLSKWFMERYHWARVV